MRAVVVGAGSWGTALAFVLAQNGHEVTLVARRQEVADGINATHKNISYLTDALLPDNLVATTDLAFALEDSDFSVIVTPSSQMRATALRFVGHVSNDYPIVLCSKGLEAQTGLIPVAVWEEVLGGLNRYAVLSGPNHAEEVIRSIPTGTVIASASNETAAFFQDAFASDVFRTYVSEDVCGVEICSAFKNVIAISVGLSYGLGFGDNTASLLLTRGLAEMGRLVSACDGQALTCMGLAGAGDLVATCMSEHSRNRKFGKMLASGLTLDDFMAETHMIAEGAYACQTLKVLSDKYGVELPITDCIRGIVWENMSAQDGVDSLIGRSLKSEFYGMN